MESRRCLILFHGIDRVPCRRGVAWITMRFIAVLFHAFLLIRIIHKQDFQLSNILSYLIF